MNLDTIEIFEKILNFVHWTFTLMLIIPIFLGWWLITFIDGSILVGSMVIGYCGMWICSALEGNAVGDDYDNYGDG